MFKNAIVRTPASTIAQGITTSNLGTVNYQNALKQHTQYIEALRQCDLNVTILDATEEFPDSTFVEDTALCTPHCAIITNPGAQSRKGETATIEQAIIAIGKPTERINPPGTVEAGDIMMVGDHYYIGLSERTNETGATQMIEALENHGMSGSIVTLTEVLHLKTGVNYIENNNLLAYGEFLQKPEFEKFNILAVDQNEAYAANSVWINDKVLVPMGFPKTQTMIEDCGYQTIAVDVSEFQKIDGGLSCLSLRF